MTRVAAYYRAPLRADFDEFVRMVARYVAKRSAAAHGRVVGLRWNADAAAGVIVVECGTFIGARRLKSWLLPLDGVSRVRVEGEP